MRRTRIAGGGCLLATALTLAAVPSGDGAAGGRARKPLPWRMLARGVFVGAAEVGRPHVAIATTRAQLLGRIGPLQESDSSRVARTNLRRFVVVGVFGGVDWTCCGGVAVRRVWLKGRQLCVVALRSPAGDTGPPSEPYHVVTIRRALVARSLPRTWRLLRPGGATMASSRGARRC